MLELPKSTRRGRGVTLNTALLAGLTAALVFVGQGHAQSGPGMGNMQNMPGMGGGGASATTSASATGTVESVNVSQRKIKLNHEPIPAFGWPAMSMEMAAAPSVDLSKATSGSSDSVGFSRSPLLRFLSSRA